ncbi:ABC transporter permease [Neptunicella marina]|uniref:FtsX-like permease family protein n=1 Tax=Neptunicella marina TaxID=2125989 RepID=A0A8J6M0L5_9ALTE|nr:FtsX-like permease family protein [Neptunicella marina]MBC3767259.1 FtsX-like permease family protein [Neptunicella marina]
MRRGELTIILFAIVLSVSAVLSLSLFSARLQSALTEKSAEFIAADRELVSSKKVEDSWLQKASQLGLNQALQRYTRSMVFANNKMQLVDVRAVDNHYPLKGKVKISVTPFAPPQETDTLPKTGEVWIDSRLFQVLQVNLGDDIEIGDAVLKIGGVVADIPDRGFSVFGNDHLLLMSMQDFAATHLDGPGSRIGYSYFFTGTAAQLSDYDDWITPNLNRELHRWRSIEDDDSAIGRSVKRAERYFLLASLLAIVLASVSIAVAAQRYSQRHFDPVAIMKTLGASRATVQKIYLVQLLLITFSAIAIGLVIGFAVQQLVIQAVADKVSVDLSGWYWQPILMAVFTGFICALLFSMYPLMRLFSVPPLRVLRRDIGANLSSKSIQLLSCGGAIFLLMLIFSGDWKMSLILFGCGILLVLGLIAFTFVLIRLGHKLGQGRISAWQLAWARIRRRSMDNAVQLISFSITLLLLLVVLVMRNDMIGQWRAQLPQDTPNYFIANITAQQLPELKQHFADLNVKTGDLYPLIRGRMAAVNGEMVRTAVSKDDDDTENRGRRGLGREAGLTWLDQIQDGNKLVAGKWFSGQSDELEVSVEQKIAERLDIKLGDVLTFNIGARVLEAKVTSLREVNWQSMKPNFYFVLQPQAMQDFPATYVTSFYLDGQDKALLTQLLAPFASISLFDVDARINQLREIIDQVSLAVEFILVLVLIAGALVLVSQVQASMDERQQELTILRTLGAKGRLIRLSVIFEFVIIGLVAGLMAAAANELTLYLLQSQIFEMESQFHWQFWWQAPLIGAGLVGALGAASCWRLLSLNTAHLLRNMF